MELTICIFFNDDGKNIANIKQSLIKKVSNILIFYDSNIKNKTELLNKNILFSNKKVQYSSIAFSHKKTALKCLSSDSGDYIWFLNEYDILKKGAIEAFLKIVKQNKNIDYIYMSSSVISQKSCPSKVFIPTVIIKKSNIITKDIVFFLQDIHYLQVGIWLNSFCNDTVFVNFDNRYVLHNKPEPFIYNQRLLYCIYKLAIKLYAYIIQEKTNSMFRGSLSVSIIDNKKLPQVALLRDYIHRYYIFYA